MGMGMETLSLLAGNVRIPQREETAAVVEKETDIVVSRTNNNF